MHGGNPFLDASWDFQGSWLSLQSWNSGWASWSRRLFATSQRLLCLAAAESSYDFRGAFLTWEFQVATSLYRLNIFGGLNIFPSRLVFLPCEGAGVPRSTQSVWAACLILFAFFAGAQCSRKICATRLTLFITSVESVKEFLSRRHSFEFDWCIYEIYWNLDSVRTIISGVGAPYASTSPRIRYIRNCNLGVWGVSKMYDYTWS